MSKNKDRIYARPQDMIVDFRFDEQVASVFPDMIRRSVPGYDTIIPLLGLFAERFVHANTNIYDLGCSLGAASLAMGRYITQPGCTIIAVDNAEAMVQQCRANVAQADMAADIDVRCADIREIVFDNASLVVINFTLQFIEPEQRLTLLKNIYQGLNPGGALVIADKIVFAAPAQQHFEEAMHLDFKKANGYSELEISQKRTALEKVLIPDTLETHIDRLQQAGFAHAYPWFQCFNFGALCAIK
ncbi:MAG: carboxy-S-adenosyl-L-methionine synthase CmoA [Gammaproteobacteria bacterium]|nr:carboxy-S-adenosyl-L-methionine synthase CmoA [Gammaproteobacteria bacterium]